MSEFTINPAGSRSGVAVTTATPVANLPSVSRNERASGAVAAKAQLLAPAVVGSPAVCMAWNAAIRSEISSAWVASAKWPVSSR